MEKFCSICEDYCQTKIQQKNETYQVKGTDISIEVTREYCATCGEILGSDLEDENILNRVNSEYRKLNQNDRTGSLAGYYITTEKNVIKKEVDI